MPRIPFFFDTVAKAPIVGEIKGYYVALAALFVAYILLKALAGPAGELAAMLAGLSAGALIFFIVAWEFFVGAKTGGIANEIKETLIALAIALLLWFGSGFLLNTQTPVNAIVSCSMLPSYERGDMVLIQGAQVNAPVAKIAGGISQITRSAKVKYPGGEADVEGSVYSYCARQGGMQGGVCGDLVANPEEIEEWHGPLKITYGQCSRIYPNTGKTVGTICANGAEIGGMKIPLGNENDLVVYGPAQGELYARVGDIVHRAAFIVEDSSGAKYYFTKGDNNPIYDFQVYDYSLGVGNGPIGQEQIKGKVILRVPYLGNLKLFITPQALLNPSTLSGCDSYYKN